MNPARPAHGVWFRRWTIVPALALFAALVLPAAAFAHVPFIEGAQRSDASGSQAVPYPQAQPLPSPTISRAIYGYLAPGAKFDAYTFTVSQEVTAEVSLIVPRRVGLQTFRPNLKIFAEGSGQVVNAPDPGAAPRTSFYEPFSVASFWNGPVTMTTFKPGERYYVVVLPPTTGRTSGAYVLTFGGAEQFSAGDWASSLEAMPVIWLGSWAGGPVRPGINVCGVVLVGVVGLAVWLWIRRRRRRRTDAAAEPKDPAAAQES
jgi:hypothetical protein